MGNQSPRAPAPQHVEDAIHNFAPRVFDMGGIRTQRRDQRLQDLPLRLRQIRGIRFSLAHLFLSILGLLTSFSPSLSRLHAAILTRSNTIVESLGTIQKVANDLQTP